MEISLNNEPVEMPSNNGPAQRRASFYQQTLERLAALPGVTAVGGVNGLPMTAGRVLQA